MKIYLDIDETILINNIEDGTFVHKPANYLKEFLTNILTKHDVYWLTTHCNGDASVPVFYLSKILPEELILLIMRIKPTRWEMRKIDAINLDENFLWFDDVLMSSEEKLLESKGKLDSFVRVDLDNNEDFFEDYLDI